MELPFPWCIYAEHQAKAARCCRISDQSWGIENGLTRFLTSVESSGIPENQTEFQRGVERAVATGSWVERNHARLRRKYLLPEPRSTEGRLLARVRLAEIRGSLSAAEWRLLVAVAVGVAYEEMTWISAGSARTRMARLRARLRLAAGQVRP